MGEASSDSDSGSGSESSANTDSQLESLAGPEIPWEKPSSLLSQENSSVSQKAQVNLEPTSSRESQTNLPLKANQKTNEPVSNESNNKQPLRKKKVLRSLRDFLYEPPIYSSWYSNENSNIIKLILNELVKTNYTYILKLPFAAAEIIRRLDHVERILFSQLNQFYSEYIKDNSNGPTPRREQSDDYLYRSAETVCPCTLDEVQKQSRKKHLNKCYTQ